MAERKIDHIVDFVDEEEAGAVGGRSITVELDDVANVDDQGQTKTTFRGDGTDPAFIRIALSDRDTPYVVEVSYGTMSKVATAIPVEATEDIFFQYETEGTLSNIPEGGVSFSWVGNTPPTSPSFNGREITMSERTVGILRCTYTYLADRWKLFSDQVLDIIIVAYQTIVDEEDPEAEPEIIIGTATATFIEEDAEGAQKEIRLQVRDFCSGDGLPGVSVWLDDISIGATDEGGYIDLGELTVGNTYNLKMTKANYIDSDVDELLNDEFTVT